MPNHVYNSLTIEDTPENIKKIKEELAKPRETRFVEQKFNQETKTWEQVVVKETSNEPISFWNMIKPDDEDLDAYFGSDSRADGGWYTWNNENWSTKWDAYDIDESDSIDDKLAVYTFTTAWSPPENAMYALSEKYPTATITLDYEEETGWGGSVVWLDGDVIESSSYDAPEYEDLDEEEIEEDKD